MIYESLIAEAHAVSSSSLTVPMTPEAWAGTLAQRRQHWLQMLGLPELPERTDLQATVTGNLERGQYVVEKLHFQSFPGAYVAGNIYRPADIREPLPAVLYLCGHSMGKVYPTYQRNPRWFGEHGYVALVLDPIQLGECQGFHAGTIFKSWFDWYSRGYTPAGVEVWNAMRALDYLQGRADVDGARLGVTGLSGGGAMSWFLAAADPRIACVAPVCQTGTIAQHAADRTVDGHCDCAFWINIQRWCTPDVGALIAPRPLLVASGTEDVIWRPQAFRDVALRLTKQYAALGASENFRLVEDISPHGYTPKLRQAIFEWFERHLKGSTAPVTDDIRDPVEDPADLAVFGGNLPEDDRMKDVAAWFIPPAAAAVTATNAAAAGTRQAQDLEKLRELTFRDTVPAVSPRLCEVRDAGGSEDGPAERTLVFEVADGLRLRAHWSLDGETPAAGPLILTAQSPRRELLLGCRPEVARGLDTLVVDVRGTGATAMGPGMHNTARRLYMNVGRTLPERQVHDLLAALALLRNFRRYGTVAVLGEDCMAPQAIYAALLHPGIDEIILGAPPASHTDPSTAEFLAVLQTGDLPENLALAFPRPITFVGGVPDEYAVVSRAYAARGAGERVRNIASLTDWVPFAARPD